MNRYEEAHLYVAAVRLLRHRSGAPPALEEVCELLQCSMEEGHAVVRGLAKKHIVEIIEDPFTIKLEIADHLAIEQLPREEEPGQGLADEIARFQAKKKNMDEKVASIQAEMERKKKEMFSDIEAKFKKEMDRFKEK